MEVIANRTRPESARTGISPKSLQVSAHFRGAFVLLGSFSKALLINSSSLGGKSGLGGRATRERDQDAVEDHSGGVTAKRKRAG